MFIIETGFYVLMSTLTEISYLLNFKTEFRAASMYLVNRCELLSTDSQLGEKYSDLTGNQVVGL